MGHTLIAGSRQVVGFIVASRIIPCYYTGGSCSFVTGSSGRSFNSHHMIFGYVVDNSLFGFSLGNNFIDLDNNSFDLSLEYFLDGCSSDLLPNIRAKNLVNCPNKMEEPGRC